MRSARMASHAETAPATSGMRLRAARPSIGQTPPNPASPRGRCSSEPPWRPRHRFRPLGRRPSLRRRARRSSPATLPRSSAAETIPLRQPSLLDLEIDRNQTRSELLDLAADPAFDALERVFDEPSIVAPAACRDFSIAREAFVTRSASSPPFSPSAPRRLRRLSSACSICVRRVAATLPEIVSAASAKRRATVSLSCAKRSTWRLSSPPSAPRFRASVLQGGDRSPPRTSRVAARPRRPAWR